MDLRSSLYPDFKLILLGSNRLFYACHYNIGDFYKKCLFRLLVRLERNQILNEFAYLLTVNIEFINLIDKNSANVI